MSGALSGARLARAVTSFMPVVIRGGTMLEAR